MDKQSLEQLNQLIAFTEEKLAVEKKYIIYSKKSQKAFTPTSTCEAVYGKPWNVKRYTLKEIEVIRDQYRLMVPDFKISVASWDYVASLELANLKKVRKQLLNYLG